MKTHKISSKELTFKQVNEILTKGYKLELSADAIKRIQKCRDYLDKKMENPEKPIYGVTTGFSPTNFGDGKMCPRVFGSMFHM